MPPNVWAATWEASLASFGWAGELYERGQDLAREGRVFDLEVSPGLVSAKVREIPPAAVDLTLRFRRFPKLVFTKAARALASRASFAASLLAGRIPGDVESAFAGTGFRLFPQSAKDIHVDCSCAEPAPCRHAAAVLATLGERFDRDPFLLFLLRGVTREGLLSALRRGRGGQGRAPLAAAEAPPIPREPLPELTADRFFRPLVPLATLRSPYDPSGDQGEGLLSRLGPAPFTDIEASRLLHDIHRAVGLGAAERLEEWEWGRAGTRK
ncbi:MAG TPA: SWIM zinc finger family protein [Thermoanaerobaculia bacterium]|nr:SWIM zinc finger family protein [Thermoanaerobaculia bacterium]